MRVFVTGATGFIGSAVVAELTKAGHQVLGLARSDAAAAWLKRAGAEVHRGSLDRPDSLAKGAAGADGVIHLAYNHDFSQIPAAANTDRGAIEAIGTALSGTGRPFVVACGMTFSTPGRPGTEEDPADPNGQHPRTQNEGLALAWASRGVRVSVVRLAPSVHGDGDHGLVPILIGIARSKGASAYVGDGSNRWPAVHRLDAASLFRLALEKAPRWHPASRGRGGRRADPRCCHSDWSPAESAGRVQDARRGCRALRLDGPLRCGRHAGFQRFHKRALRVASYPGPAHCRP